MDFADWFNQSWSRRPRYTGALFSRALRLCCGLCLLLSTLSCDGTGNLDSSEVSPESIWARYAVESLESEDTVRVLANFRLNDSAGATIILKDPSRVEVKTLSNGLFLTLSPTQELGAFGQGYEAVLERSDLNRDVVLAWTDPFGNRVENVIERVSTPLFDVNRGSVEFSRQESLRVGFSLDNDPDVFGEGISITCQLLSKEPSLEPAAPVDERDPDEGVVGAPKKDPEPPKPNLGELKTEGSRDAGCVFPASDIVKFRAGSATLQVISERKEENVSGHKAGGERISRAFGRLLWLRVRD